MVNKVNSSDSVTASIVRSSKQSTSAFGGGVFHARCFDTNGNLKWEDRAHNLVVNQGLQDMNNKYFNGSSYNASFYLGLITGPSSSTVFSPTDTLATHPGWTEFTTYTGTRKPMTFGTANYNNPSVLPNASVNFLITVGGTVAGAFLCTGVSGPAGILFSEADFQSPGDRIVIAGDVLSVGYTFSLSAA